MNFLPRVLAADTGDRATANAGDYWEARARRFAVEGDGLAAVCSYGMPAFYNRAIDWTQQLALRPWLRNLDGLAVLDVGCGIGRWSRMMAARGAHVTGVDLSATMIAEAARRTRLAGLESRCRFRVADVTQLDIDASYDFVLGVTVLQHLLSVERIDEAFRRLAGRLARRGRMVLVEVAPSQANSRCDTHVFTAHAVETYVRLGARHGLRLVAVTGVDPTPLKTRFLPHYKRLPRPLALGGLAAVTALSLPIDALLGRRLARFSWHKVLVFEAADQIGHAR
jgi:2-polyprenyl-3-methyl-5-hydroxy-6-metoxy-1,4-benzoquinol methylase